MHFIFLILMIKSVKLCSYKSALNSLLKPQVFKTSLHPTNTGPRSAVGNVSGYRCVSDCRSRGRGFDPGPVPYFSGD